MFFMEVMSMQKTVKLVGYGVDTLILNVRYADKQGQPVKQELDDQLAATTRLLTECCSFSRNGGSLGLVVSGCAALCGTTWGG